MPPTKKQKQKHQSLESGSRLARDAARLGAAHAESEALRSALARERGELAAGLAVERAARGHAVALHADALEAR